MIPVEQHVTIVTNDRGEASGMYGLITDITARKEADLALVEANAALAGLGRRNRRLPGWHAG
ncbi:MAG: hypothetical protein HC828_16090 [Blastochloris sp.]|nr:hypothetical protein [Blastochloris sp.]